MTRARKLTVALIGVVVLTSRPPIASGTPMSGVADQTACAGVSSSNEGTLAQDPRTGPHVRTEDPQLSKAIGQGFDESPTFRQLINCINSLSGIVHVVSSRCGTRLWEPGACLDHRVTVSGGFRFLRVNIYPGESGARLVALIGHELQHAVEVLSDESATSQEDVAKLFERIGIQRKSSNNFETEDAQRVEDAVYREMRVHRLAR